MKLGTARLFVLAFVLLIAPLTGEAQAPGKVWRVAVLTGGLPRSAAPVRALEQRLAELGYAATRSLRSAHAAGRSCENDQRAEGYAQGADAI